MPCVAYALVDPLPLYIREADTLVGETDFYKST